MPPVSSADFRSLRPSTTALERLLEQIGFMTQREGESGLGLVQPVPTGGWTRWFSQLLREGRALSLVAPDDGQRLWIATPRLDWILSLDERWQPSPPPGGIPRDALPSDRGAIWQWLIESRRRIEGERAFETVVGVFDLAGVTADA